MSNKSASQNVIEMIPYDPNVDLPYCVVFDIDGTLAKMTGRSPYDYSRVSEDERHDDVFELLFMFREMKVPIVLVSGRPESCREDTKAWLERHGLDMEEIELFMRPAGDNRKDSIIKYELFDQNLRNRYRIKAWFDDRNRVVETMRSIGIRVYQVAPGDF